MANRKMHLAATLLLAALTAIMAPGAQAQQPMRAHIYPDVSSARGDIQGALVMARKEHKRVLLDFGGDWCGDCQVLNLYFHQPENLKLLNDNFVLVDVNIGHIDQNLDLGTRYGVTLKRGVPALAVLSSSGRVVYAQKNGEFEDMRNMDPSSVHDFLEKWK